MSAPDNNSYLELLVQKAKAGDSQAFDRLHQETQQAINWSINNLFLAGADASDKESFILQGIWNAINSYQPGNSVASYVGTCVRRRVLTEITASRRNHHLPLNHRVALVDEEDKNYIDTAVDPHSLDAFDSVDLDDRWQALSKRMEQCLSEMEFKIWTVRTENPEFTYQQIADELHLKRKTVDNSLVRIRETLGKMRNDPVVMVFHGIHPDA